MKLDNNALLKAAGIGAGAMVVLSLLSQIPIVGLACCCLVWLGYAGVGALYGYFARQNGMMIEAGPIALGGAIAAAIAGVAQGLVSGIISLIFTTGDAMAQALTQLEASGIDVPPEMASMYTGATFGIFALFMGLCFSIVIGAVLGAVGGAIYGATQRDTLPPPPPAEPVPPAM